MGSRWKGIAVPAIGLFAVIAVAAIVAGASIVLFPSEDPLEAAPPPPIGSSEVTQVTAPPSEEATDESGREPGDLVAVSPAGPGTSPSASAPFLGVPAPLQPPAASRLAREAPSGGRGQETPTPARGIGGEPKDKDKGNKDKDKGKKGNAHGHDKSHGNGKAKGHDKSHGDKSPQAGKSKPAPVRSSPPRGQKHDHVSNSGAGKQAGRGHRPRSRPRR